MSERNSFAGAGSLVIVVYLIGVALGFWNGSRTEVEFDERIMWHIRGCERPGTLRFEVDDHRFVEYEPDTDKYVKNFILTRGDSPALPNADIASAVTGTTIGWSANSLLRSQYAVRIINRLSGRSQTQRVLGALVGLLTGYSVGHYMGLQRARSSSSEQVQKLVLEQETWRKVAPDFLGFRLRMVGESLDDLAPYVRDKFEHRIEQAYELLGSPSSTTSFAAKAATVCAIEKDVKPHFGFWRSFWDEQIQTLRYMFAFVLGLAALMLAIGLVLLVKKRGAAARR